MCNIITYQFACPHRVRRRRSPCHGAKARPASNRSAPRVACVAECFLTVYLRAPCNECYHKIWDATWQAKISRADAYLGDLKEQYNSTEAVQTIEALRQEIEERRKAEEWALRHSITLLPARHVPRVKHRKFVRSSSPLEAEVKAEDVHERGKEGKDWNEMTEEDYDDDYIASTDPIHPVTTDYRFPGEGEDDEWVKQYLADGIEEDGVEEGGESGGWDDSGGWDWGDGDDEGGGAVQEDENWKDDGFLPAEEQPDGPDNIGQAALAALTADFWSHVNLTSEPTATSSQHHPDMEPPSPPPTTPPWIDGAHDSPSTEILVLNSPAQPLSSQATNRNPRRTHYDNQRRMLMRRKDLDESKFYRDWLILSRCEMREYESLGEGGRKISEPSHVKK